MSLLSGLMGHASSVDVGKLQETIGSLLTADETIQAGYQLIRDQFVFTNKRLLLIDKKGLTGSQVSIVTIPYKSILYFEKISAGLMDLESELIIKVKGFDAPITKKFSRNDNVNEVYKLLSTFVLS